MAGDVDVNVSILGKPLVCAVCGGTKFWSRKTLLTKPVAEMFAYPFANQQAVNFVCSKCGYVFWFIEMDSEA